MEMLVTPHWLSERISKNGDLCVIDCRFSLSEPAAGQQAYNQYHIPTAIYADLEKDLSSPIIEGVTGRHPLPEIETFCEQVRRWGVNQNTTVVLYDQQDGSQAARLWWLLTWLGKAQVAILDGGLQAWENTGLETTDQQVTRVIGNFEGQPDSSMLVTADEIQQQLDNPVWTLVDARGKARFAGQHEPIDPVAGHIPGALNLPYQGNLSEIGCFLPKHELINRFKTLPVSNVTDLVCYCGSGVTACHNIFSMELTGLGRPRLYPGSWSEWIASPERPVATSAEKN